MTAPITWHHLPVEARHAALTAMADLTKSLQTLDQGTVATALQLAAQELQRGPGAARSLVPSEGADALEQLRRMNLGSGRALRITTATALFAAGGQPVSGQWLREQVRAADPELARGYPDLRDAIRHSLRWLCARGFAERLGRTPKVTWRWTS